jgi:hypothetical protein
MRLPVTIRDLKVVGGGILIMVHLKGDGIAEQSADVCTHRAQLRSLPIVSRDILARMQFFTDGVCIELLTPGSLRVSLMPSAAAELMAGDAKLKRIRVSTILGSKFCSWEPNGLNAEYLFFVVMSRHAENIAYLS